MKQTIIQFIKFGIVGLSNTLIGYLIYLAVLLSLQKNHLIPDTDYLAAHVVSFFLSVLWSFYWNRKYVFQMSNKTIPWQEALFKVYCSYAFTGLLLSTILSMIWVRIFHINKLFVPFLNLAFSVPINFLLNKFWAFKQK